MTQRTNTGRLAGNSAGKNGETGIHFKTTVREMEETLKSD